MLYRSRFHDECERDHHLGYKLLNHMAQIVINRLEARELQVSLQKDSVPFGAPLNFNPYKK